MLKKLQVLFVAGALLCVSQAQAGNWLRNEHERLYTAEVKFSAYNDHWDQYGTLIPNGQGHVNRQDSYQSFEYGYSYYYTLVGGVGIHNIEIAGASVASGLGDIDLGVRGRIHHDQNGKAWELKLLVPGGYDNSAPQRLGYGRFGAEAGVYFGEQFDPYDIDPYRPGYQAPPDSSWEYGGRIQAWMGAPAPEVMGYIKWNHSLPRDWSMSAILENTSSLGQGTTEYDNLGAPRQPFYDVLLTKVEFKHPIGDGWSFHITPLVNLAGSNIGKATGVTFGLNRLWMK